MTRYKRQKEPPPSAGFVVAFIWKLINERKLSQQDVSKASGVSTNTLRKWRDGSRSPTLENIQSVLYILGYKLTITERTNDEIKD